MSESNAGAAHGPAHGPAHYVKIWAVLVGLLVLSVVGPMLGHPMLTLFTAFGIALVKAFLVVTKFMHLTVEKRFVPYILGSMLAVMAVFVAAVAPDVMAHEGARWSNEAAKAVVKQGLAEEAAHGSASHGEHEAHGK